MVLAYSLPHKPHSERQVTFHFSPFGINPEPQIFLLSKMNKINDKQKNNVSTDPLSETMTHFPVEQTRRAAWRGQPSL